METRPVPSNPLYEVSEYGDVRRIGNEAWLRPQTLIRGGYLAVSIWRNGRGRLRTIHSLVAEAFLPPKPSHSYQLAHNDGDRTNNHWRNLRWATRSENEQDKVGHGTSNRGERNGCAKITDREAALIRHVCLGGPRGVQALFAEFFGVHQSTISNITHGKRRQHDAQI